MKRDHDGYAAGGTPTDVKEYRASLAVALKRRGVPLSDFLEANNETEFPVSQSTLYTHVKAVEEGGSALSAEKATGRPTKLTEEQWDIVAGAILTCTEKTDLQWVLTWIATHFRVKLAFSTVSRHLNELDLCFRLTGGRPMPRTMTEESYVMEYYECVLKLRDTGFFAHDPCKVIAVDCCTNSRRLDRVTTISMIGPSKKNCRLENQSTPTRTWLLSRSKTRGSTQP